MRTHQALVSQSQVLHSDLVTENMRLKKLTTTSVNAAIRAAVYMVLQSLIAKDGNAPSPRNSQESTLSVPSVVLATLSSSLTPKSATLRWPESSRKMFLLSSGRAMLNFVL